VPWVYSTEGKKKDFLKRDCFKSGTKKGVLAGESGEDEAGGLRADMIKKEWRIRKRKKRTWLTKMSQEVERRFKISLIKIASSMFL